MGDIWTYSRCKVLRVIDADTLEMDINLGLRMHHTPVSVRLLDCYAPERNTIEGQAAIAFVKEKLWTTQSIKVASEKWEWSFNRVVGTVLLDHVSLAQMLIDNGHATPTK